MDSTKIENALENIIKEMDNAARPNFDTPEMRTKFEEQILPLLLDDDFESFGFEGENCDTSCGWDGMSRRCHCGNRRVSWVYDQAGQPLGASLEDINSYGGIEGGGYFGEA